MAESVEGLHTYEVFDALVKVASDLLEEEGLPNVSFSQFYFILESLFKYRISKFNKKLNLKVL